MPTRSNCPSSLLSAAISRSPWNTLMPTCSSTCACACVRVCTRACVYVCVRVPVCVCVCVCTRSCVQVRELQLAKITVCKRTGMAAGEGHRADGSGFGPGMTGS